MDVYYSRWKDILKRCYSESFHANNHSYIGCSVCEEWKTFSIFKAWLVGSGFDGTQVIDKDLLFRGNKLYSPETCVLIDSELNSFLAIGGRGSHLPHGVGLQSGKCVKPYTAKIKDSVKTEYIGSYETAMDAHKAWQNRKYQAACNLSLRYDDPIRAFIVNAANRILEDIENNRQTKEI